jgi:hypothetical protein
MSNCTAVRQARAGDALLSGTTLYGIDAIATSDIAIYAINTSTGVATQISTLTGLPSNIFLSMRQRLQPLRAGQHVNYSFFR